MPRNYRKEYDRYQGTPAQKKARARRNAARNKMMAAGKASKGDGKDIAHKNGNNKDNKMSNLASQSKSKNRSFRRTRTAGKKNKND